MKLPTINGWTALLAAIALGGIFAAVHYKLEPTTFGIYATLVLGVMTQASKLLHFGDTPKGDPPPKGPSVKEPEEASKGDGGALKKHPYRDPASQPGLAPPKLPPRAAHGPKSYSEREDRIEIPVIAFAVVTTLCFAGCGLFSPKNVLDVVLKASDVACLMTGDGSKTDDPDAAAIACKLAQDPTLRDIAKQLVGQRVAAKRAGFVWKPVAVGSDGLPANDNGDGGIAETVAKSSKDGGK